MQTPQVMRRTQLLAAFDNSPLALESITDDVQLLEMASQDAFLVVDSDPAPNDPISVTKAEFFAVLDDLEQAGLPVRDNREKAWRDFAGWRVNYDPVLLALCALVDAPPAVWSSDRCTRFHRPNLRHPRSWRVEPLDAPTSW